MPQSFLLADVFKIPIFEFYFYLKIIKKIGNNFSKYTLVLLVERIPFFS
jgi:hypothetical protein